MDAVLDVEPADGHALSDVLIEFAQTVVTDFPIQAILDHLVVRIVDVLPIDAAGVTLISPGTHPRYVAASSDAAMRFEQLQSDLAEGPCVGAYISGEAVSIPSVRDDRRFPRFSPRALEQGLESAFTFPLNHGGSRLGALDLYRTSPGQLDEATMRTAQTLADVASAYLLNAQARADLEELRERARQEALHDALTGLPNRALLFERLNHAIVRGRRSGKLVGVLFVDLDLFKVVNDSYGHHVGDQLLVALSDRLTGQLRAGDTVSRLAGDEFVILIEDLAERPEIDAIADRIKEALSHRFILSELELKVTASVGIAFAGGGDVDAGQVLRDADAAMYRAKREGGARAVTSTVHREARNIDLRAED